MTDSGPTGRLRAILVVIATFATIVFNFLAAMGRINGVTPEEISDNYLTPITPAGYAFSIWSLIYVGLIAFSIYQVLRANRSKFKNVRTLYIVSCALNCTWIYFWHHDQIILCSLIILSLAGCLFFINLLLQKTEGHGEYWLVKAPFSIYFGWVTAATFVNFAVFLKYIRIDISEIVGTSIAVFLITLAAALGIYIRSKLNNDLYPLAIAWALTAIAVKQSGKTAIVVACAVGVVACLIATLSFVVNLPSHTTPRPVSK